MFHFVYCFILLFNLTSFAYAQEEDVGEPPQELQVSKEEETVTLTWQDKSNNELGFRIERRKGEGAAWIPLVTVEANTATYSDMVMAGHTYCYRVYAFFVWSSLFSNEACIVVPKQETPPQAPRNVILNAAMILKWDKSKGATGYHILCNAKGFSHSPAGEVPGHLNIIRINKHVPSQQPSCFVQAWNEYGVSEPSNIARIQ